MRISDWSSDVCSSDLIADTDVRSDATGWYISDAALDRVHNAAVAGGYALIEFHNHRRGPAGFSRTDEAGLEPMANYATDLLPGRPYGAGVYADGPVHVEHWRSERQTSELPSQMRTRYA